MVVGFKTGGIGYWLKQRVAELFEAFGCAVYSSDKESRKN